LKKLHRKNDCLFVDGAVGAIIPITNK